MTPVKIKICGLTREEDIIAVNSVLPEYVGFVFAESRRKVTPDYARHLSHKLSGNIKKVGVFARQGFDEIICATDTSGVDIIQLCGEEPPALVSKLIDTGIEVWKVIHIGEAGDSEKIEEYKADRFLFDTKSNALGGSGRRFDLNLLKDINLKRHIIAGGLTPENVQEAAGWRPYCLDVSSGVESEGYKDMAKIKAFADAVRGAQINGGINDEN